MEGFMRTWLRALLPALGVAVLVATQHATAAPAAGDAYVYVYVNGYSRLVRGHVHYRVERTDAGRVEFSVTPDNADAGIPRNELYTQDGNWLLHPVESHGWKVGYL